RYEPHLRKAIDQHLNVQRAGSTALTFADKFSPAMRHAPGPWHAEPFKRDRGASIAICTKQQGVLAIIPPLSNAHDKTSALRDECDYPSAHLMAAAPELLEACKAALADYEAHIPSATSIPAILRAAIANATTPTHQLERRHDHE